MVVTIVPITGEGHEMADGKIAGVGNQLPALQLVQSSRLARQLAALLLVLLLLSIVSMLLLPWQQSARGTGRVVAFVPQERQQSVMSPIKGVVSRVADNLSEGIWVRRGDVIVEIEPTAANLSNQLAAQMRDMETKLETARVQAEVYGRNVIDFRAAREAALDAADELIAAAQAKWDAKQRLLPGYEAKELRAQLNYDRQRGLFEKGIKPEKEMELMREDFYVAKSQRESVQRDIEAAHQEWKAKQNERIQKEREWDAKVDYARAMQQDALGKLATIQKEQREIEIKLSELDRLVIEAPRDGTLFRLPVYERGQTIKEGDHLFTIVPDTSERAVELWLSGNDTSLVRAGDHVRLQFEGWPAVQFAGWPSVAVGTFGGRVMAIDPTDDGTGKFRIQVVQEGEDDWPSDRYLRQGVRANGWVMLNQVSLGYEIWRQLNGFPPVVSKEREDQMEREGKRKPPVPK
jgi:multidrug resistance efflux pump